MKNIALSMLQIGLALTVFASQFPVTAHGDENLQADPNRSSVLADFANAREELMKRVLTTELKKIDGFKIQELDLRMAAIPVSTASAVSTSEDMGTVPTFRKAARWNVDSDGICKIKVSETDWPMAPANLKGVLALHESFGCLNIYDETYNCSSLLDIIATDPDYKSLKPDDRHRILKYTANACSPKLQIAEGGSTGVGGGGGWMGLEMKFHSLEEHIAELLKADGNPSARQEAIDEIESTFYIQYEGFF